MNTPNNDNTGGQEPAFNAARLTIPVDIDLADATKKADEFLQSFAKGMEEAAKIKPQAEGGDSGRPSQMQAEDREQQREQFMTDWRRVAAFILDIRNVVVEIRDMLVTKEHGQ